MKTTGIVRSIQLLVLFFIILLFFYIFHFGFQNWCHETINTCRDIQYRWDQNNREVKYEVKKEHRKNFKQVENVTKELGNIWKDGPVLGLENFAQWKNGIIVFI